MIYEDLETKHMNTQLSQDYLTLELQKILEKLASEAAN